MKTIPILPIKSTVIFPGTSSPLRVGRAQSIAALRHAQEQGSWIIALSQKNETDSVLANDLYRVGTLAKIEKLRGDETRGYQVILRGEKRYRVDDIVEKDGQKRFLTFKIATAAPRARFYKV